MSAGIVHALLLDRTIPERIGRPVAIRWLGRTRIGEAVIIGPPVSAIGGVVKTRTVDHYTDRAKSRGRLGSGLFGRIATDAISSIDVAWSGRIVEWSDRVRGAEIGQWYRYEVTTEQGDRQGRADPYARSLRDPAEAPPAVGRINGALEALERNPNERLLLESLLWSLPPLR